MKLQFSIGITSNPRTWPVIDGRIAPEAIELVPTVLHPSELFWRQLRFAEFDVAEMSMSSLLMARSKGDDQFVGIPVFTTRRFFHTGILVRGATGFVPPPGVTVHRIPTEKNIGSMMISGELDATLFYLVDPNLIDRSTADLHRHPDIKLLFVDPLAEGIRYHRKTGLYPINHGMVIRRELAEKHPWAVLNIIKAL